MIVFLNGAFGVGKTTLAERLVARLPNSLLYDAEEVGYFLGKIVAPIDRPDDFQHLPMWRSLTVTTAHLLRQTYGRTLVMPMTIWRRPCFDEVLGGLRAGDPEVYHFSLTATAETLAGRLRRRGDSPEVFAWCWARAERCIAAFQDPVFAVQIATDGKTPDELTAELLALLPATAGGEE